MNQDNRQQFGYDNELEQRRDFITKMLLRAYRDYDTEFETIKGMLDLTYAAKTLGDLVPVYETLIEELEK